MRELVVGSRGSELALRQTHGVMNRLVELNPGITCRLQVIKTTGDKILDSPLSKIGDKGLFVKEIEQALLRGDIDFAVHSAKDLPSEMDDALCVAAFPERENPADALISKSGGLMDLPPGSTIGTSSVRRKAQLLAARPDLTFVDLRGNLDTRLRKLCGSQYDAIVLACAGLKRMNLESRITEVLPFNVCLPAVGQGSLAIQCREDNSVIDMLALLDHPPTSMCVRAERALLAALGGGCQVPVAALAHMTDDGISLDALVASLDGTKIIRKSKIGDSSDPEAIGRSLANELLNSPASELLQEARSAGTDQMGAAG